MRANNVLTFLFILTIVSCQPKTGPLKEGKWRGAFILPDQEIPFQFEVKGESPDSAGIFLINGEDRFRLNHISYYKDSFSVPIDLYDTELRGKADGDVLQGNLVKHYIGKPDDKIPFIAEFNKPRFAQSGENPSASLDGTWDINLINANDTDKTVGVFKQDLAVVTGSILTTTGDYRFLEGIIHGNKFELSAFGGSTPYLLKGEFSNENLFTGEFITPKRKTKLFGSRNPHASLPDPYTASPLKDGYSSLEFSFPNLEGKQISLSDARYSGKVVVVTILGSWCPNCLDENAYLSGWYKANKERGVEIIGLGFERKNDFESAKKSLSNLKTRLGITYEILFAGQSGTASASQALPALKGISAFPTTIFIDKKGKVRKVHTGFNGPATGKFYEEYKIEFNTYIDGLLNEK
ncbi:MAG TPA: TlpA disulfide reductase family protein [Prolixibacteraceae bacterium]|nr:TlpA disulfide reductase family protein [Prolixibacteraceae bacterium]